MNILLPLLLLLFAYSAYGNSQLIPDLPEPVSNNAVAKVDTNTGRYLISFMGLGAGKTHADVHNKVWTLKIGDKSWKQTSPVPSSLTLDGRLASIAVGVKNTAYVFGGYTVADDHTEVSSPDSFRFNPLTHKYTKIAPMPVPTDDAIALVFQDRYVYLISGWHNDGNVNLVQIYDTKTDTWQQGSPFLGQPVFGHSGGIVKNKMLICDGVVVKAQAQKRRTFEAAPACYLGIINEQQLGKVDWRVIPHPTGIARYRMAASGYGNLNTIIFVGGSENPYNYNGLGYDGKPSEPTDKVWLYNLDKEQWSFSKTEIPSMDHRGLIILPEQQTALIIGGIGANQVVTNTVQKVNLSTIKELN